MLRSASQRKLPHRQIPRLEKGTKQKRKKQKEKEKQADKSFKPILRDRDACLMITATLDKNCSHRLNDPTVQNYFPGQVQVKDY